MEFEVTTLELLPAEEGRAGLFPCAKPSCFVTCMSTCVDSKHIP